MSKVTKPVKKKKKPKNYYFDQVVENAIIRYNKSDDARLKNVIYNDLLACSTYKTGLESAKNVSAKTTLILGGEDMLTPRRFCEKLIASFSSPEIKEIPSSGHSLMMEQPNDVLNYLIQAL